VLFETEARKAESRQWRPPLADTLDNLKVRAPVLFFVKAFD